MGTVTDRAGRGRRRSRAPSSRPASRSSPSSRRRRRDGARRPTGARSRPRQVFANVAPAVLDRLLGAPATAPPPEGAQLKVNMLLRRLPRLRDAVGRARAGVRRARSTSTRATSSSSGPTARPRPAACPTSRRARSTATRSPTRRSCRRSCGGRRAHADAVRRCTCRPGCSATTRPARWPGAGSGRWPRSTRVLAEPIEDCLLDPSTIEVMGPLEIEADLGMPGGPHLPPRPAVAVRRAGRATSAAGASRPTTRDVFLCGAGARRGGGVSGIPGRNAAMAALCADGSARPADRSVQTGRSASPAGAGRSAASVEVARPSPRRRRLGDRAGRRTSSCRRRRSA